MRIIVMVHVVSWMLRLKNHLLEVFPFPLAGFITKKFIRLAVRKHLEKVIRFLVSLPAMLGILRYIRA